MRLLIQFINILFLIPTLLAQTSNIFQFESDMYSFFSSLADSPTWSSQEDFLATDPALASNPAVQTALGDIDPFLILELSDPTAFFAAAVAAVPAPAQPIFASVFSGMLSVAAKDGFTGSGTATSASGSFGYTLPTIPTITALGSDLSSIAAAITSGAGSMVTVAPTDPSGMSASTSIVLSTNGSIVASVSNSGIAGLPSGLGNMSVSSSTALSNGGSTMASTPSVTNAAVTSGSATASSAAPITSSHNVAASHTILAGGVVAGVAALAILL